MTMELLFDHLGVGDAGRSPAMPIIVPSDLRAPTRAVHHDPQTELTKKLTTKT
jgi:hypothetical protein